MAGECGLGVVTKAQELVCFDVCRDKSELMIVAVTNRNRRTMLLASRMGLATVCKYVVRPGLFVDLEPRMSGWIRTLWRRDRARFCRPIVRRVHNAPNVSMCVESRADQKKLAVVTQGKAVCHSCRHTASAWQAIQHDGRFEGQRACALKTASLSAHYQYRTVLGERTPPVETRHADRNLDPQAGAAAGSFGSQNFHDKYRLRTARLLQARSCSFHCGRSRPRTGVTEVTALGTNGERRRVSYRLASPPAISPPSRVNTCPVAKAASSDAKYAKSPAISSGVA